MREDPSSLIKHYKDDPTFRLQIEGVKVFPGEYVARLNAAGRTLEQKFKVRLDPRIKTSAKDLAESEKAVRRMVRMVGDMEEALYRIRNADDQLSKAERSTTNAGQKLSYTEMRKTLGVVWNKFQPIPGETESLNLRAKLNAILRQVRNYTGRPTKVQAEYIDIIDKQVQQVLVELDAVLAKKM